MKTGAGETKLRLINKIAPHFYSRLGLPRGLKRFEIGKDAGRLGSRPLPFIPIVVNRELAERSNHKLRMNGVEGLHVVTSEDLWYRKLNSSAR